MGKIQGEGLFGFVHLQFLHLISLENSTASAGYGSLPEVTKDYRAFLEGFFLANDIKSVSLFPAVCEGCLGGVYRTDKGGGEGCMLDSEQEDGILNVDGGALAVPIVALGEAEVPIGVRVVAARDARCAGSRLP